MVTEGNACGAIPWILLGLPMVDTTRFQGLHYNHDPTGRAFGSFAAIMCRTVTVVTGTTARVAPTRFGGSPRRERRPRVSPPLDALVRTPREGCPYRDPRRERRPRRSVGKI